MASAVILYIGQTDVQADATIINATNELAPNGGTYNFANLTLNTVYHVWCRIIDPMGIDRNLSLGRFRVEDTAPPVIVTATATLSADRPASRIDIAWNITDNYAVESVYVLLSNTQSTAPEAALIKSVGSRVTPPATTITFTILSPGTRYYGWILARDGSGNETAVTRLTPASLVIQEDSFVTAEDITPPVVDSFSLTARSSTNPETEIVLQITLSDIV